MSNEELIQKYREGYFQALDELTIKNMNLIKSVAKQFHIKTASMEFDDLVQEGWTGFYRAIQTYKADHEKKASFSTWAVFWIRQRISRYLNQKTPKTEEVSIFEIIADDLTLADTLDDPEAEQKFWRYIELKELHQELEEAMNKNLTLRQAQILKLHYGWDNNEPMSYEKIGELLGTSRQSIAQTRITSFRKLRNSRWGMKYKRELITRRIEKSWDTKTKAILEIYRKEIMSMART